MSVVIVLAIGVLSAFWRAFVITKLWGWYVVTGFGVDQIDMFTAFGSALLLGFVVYQTPTRQKGDGDDIAEMIYQSTLSVMVPLFALAFGWIGTLVGGP